MTKSTITREQLEEWVAQFDEDGSCDATDRQLEALIRQSLAAMAGEPVAYMYDGEDGTEYNGHNEFSGGGKGIPLYRHAQQPVDSEPVGYLFHNEYGAVLYSISDDATEGFSLIGPIYSAPQPAPVVPCKWIPVSERMPPSRHEVLVGRWWGEKLRWCCKWATYIPGHPDSHSSGWLIPGASWTPTHWMPLPAAPQEPSLACISKRSQHLS
ncbi:TPA: DUF551 domain-containing protein [Klebsiella pneumoniae]|nr:DUF551 domain-containing protein [Klebsiella pneumoniae]